MYWIDELWYFSNLTRSKAMLFCLMSFAFLLVYVSVKLANNPMTTTSAMALLSVVKKNRYSALELLDMAVILQLLYL